VGLVRLDLAGNKINGKKLAPILDAFALPALRHLGLADSNLKVEGAKTLASTTALARLESLDLRGNTFKHEGAGLLAKAEGFPALVELELAGNTIDAVGLRALAEGPFMARVRALSLAQNKCGTEGGKALSRWPGLSALTSLSLSYNWMGVLGARALLERAGSLQVLHAGENNYGPRARPRSGGWRVPAPAGAALRRGRRGVAARARHLPSVPHPGGARPGGLGDRRALCRGDRGAAGAGASELLLLSALACSRGAARAEVRSVPADVGQQP
jgi:hypothetical protein